MRKSIGTILFLVVLFLSFIPVIMGEYRNNLNDNYEALIDKHWQVYDSMCICQLSKLAKGYVDGCCSEKV